MEEELKTLMLAIQDLVEGGDENDDSIAKAFKIMEKYGYMEGEYFIYPEHRP